MVADDERVDTKPTAVGGGLEGKNNKRSNKKTSYEKNKANSV